MVRRYSRFERESRWRGYGMKSGVVRLLRDSCMREEYNKEIKFKNEYVI